MPADTKPVVTGAVEGDLDEAVLRRLAEHVGASLGAVHGRKGKASLLHSIGGYNNAARYVPWAILVDLDRDCDCAPPCIQRWLPNPSRFMCFRIAVRAIESWLLADRERIAAWLKVRVARVPLNPDALDMNPDALDNPKRALVDLARRSSSRTVRDALVPREGSGRSVGLLYTARMTEFVLSNNGGWRPGCAQRHSQSLSRCLGSLHRLVEQLGYDPQELIGVMPP